MTLKAIKVIKTDAASSEWKYIEMVHNFIGYLLMVLWINGCVVGENDHNYTESDNSSERGDIVDASDHIPGKSSNGFERKSRTSWTNSEVESLSII